MDAQVFSAFVQEFVKEAVTVDDLHRGVFSAKKVLLATPDMKGFDRYVSASSRLTTPQLRAYVRTDPANIRIDNAQKVLRQQSSPILRAHADRLEKGKVKMDSVPVEERGEIRVNPKVMNVVTPVVAGRPPLRTPESQKALTALNVSHELAERAVHPRDMIRFSSHAAPEVLLKERNAIARLEGPGAREAADMLAAAREQTGEAQHMRNLLTRTYGPRAAQFLEGDQKVPKAMLRNLRRRLQKNPALLHEADPDRSMGLLERIRTNTPVKKFWPSAKARKENERYARIASEIEALYR